LLSDGKSPYTACNYLSVVRKFYEWAEGQKYYPNVAKAVKSPKRPADLGREPLTAEQFVTLIEATTGKRDRALLNLLGRTGMRTIEAARAKVGDFALMDGRRVLRVHGKGRHTADNFVIVFDKCFGPLAEYLRSRGIDIESPTDAQKREPLFTSISQNSHGKALSTRSIRAAAREAMERIGLHGREFSAHSLRHTAGTNLYDAGATVQQIQATLRHANPSTSQIYFRHALKKHRLTASGEAILEKIF
jgi:integrase/recombinase XerC/integrase/recombinase XerD